MQNVKQELNERPVGANSVRPQFKDMTLKNQKGITLIALIITIIVMLILVGVTVNVALNGGLFTKAEQATQQMEVSMVKEQFEIAKAVEIANNGGKKLEDYSIITIDKLDLDQSTKDEYKNKIFMSAKGDVCYNPENVTEKEKENFEAVGIKPGEVVDNSDADYFTQENGTITGLSDLGKEQIANGKTTFIIPSEIDGQTITAIGTAALSGRDFNTGSTTELANVTEFIIPGNVKTIGDYAFAMSGIEEIIIPEGVISVGGMVFSGCTSLTYIEVPSTMVSFCQDADTFDGHNENLVIKINKPLEEAKALCMNWDSGITIYDQAGNIIDYKNL